MKKIGLSFLLTLCLACSHTTIPRNPRIILDAEDHDEAPQTIQTLPIVRSPDQDSWDDSKTEAWRDNVGIGQHFILEGYPEKTSFAPGEILNLMVNAVDTDYELSIARYGGSEIEQVVEPRLFKEFKQVTPPESYKVGCKWKPTFTMRIPLTWKSGFYYAELKPTHPDAYPFYFPIVIRGSNDSNAKIAVLASTNTWNAYNFWGGASIYKDFRGNQKLPRAVFVNNSRPNYANFPDGRFSNEAEIELFFLEWLEKNNYHYDLYSDFDFHTHPELLRKYDVVVINGHSEYWSKEMFDGLEYFVDHGGNLISLSANEIYAKVTFKDDIMETYRALPTGGYTHSQTGEPGGLWTDTLNRSEASLLGSRYFSPPAASAGPFVVLNPNHWVFKGTGVKKGDWIGKSGRIDNYGIGASGWETNRVDPKYSPKNIEILAEGKHFNPAQMVYYKRTGNGGEVFSVGSLTFGGSIEGDPVLTQMMKNVLNRFTKRTTYSDLD